MNIFFPLFDWSHSKPIVKKLLGWAVHKGGWRKGSKIDQNLPTNCFRKLLTWEGGGKEDVDVFYGWSLMEVRRNCSPREGSFHFHIQSLISLFSLAASDGRQTTTAAGKGQIISKQNCGVLNFPKSNEIIVRSSALASKMGQIKKKWYIPYFHWC